MNFIVLNFMAIVVTVIFTKGFKSLITKSSETRDASIIGPAKLAENRDADTGNHLQRIHPLHAETIRKRGKLIYERE